MGFLAVFRLFSYLFVLYNKLSLHTTKNCGILVSNVFNIVLFNNYTNKKTGGQMRKVLVILSDEEAEVYDKLKATLGDGITWRESILRGLELIKKKVDKKRDVAKRLINK